MTYSLARLSGAATAITLLAQVAAADVTPADVWADIKAQIEGQGYSVTATETRSGNALTLSEMTLEQAEPSADANITATLPEMTLTGEDDGSVTVSMAESAPISVTAVVDEDGEQNTFSVDMTLTQSSPGFTVTGDPDAMTYDYASETLALELGEITSSPDPLPEGAELAGGFEMRDVASKSVVTIGALRSVSQTFSAASVTYEIDAKMPDDEGGEGDVKLAGDIASVAADGTVDYPLSTDADMSTDPAAYLNAGFAMGTTATFGQATTRMEGTGDGTPFSFASSSESGTYSVGMDRNSFLLDIGAQGQKLELTSGQLPFPMSIEMETGAFGLEIPVMKSETPQGFSATLAMEDFTMSDDIWKLVDPQSVLPREPMSAALNVNGLLTMLKDLMDPSELVGETPPVELNELSLNSLLLKAAGAQLFAQGAATFDNSDTETFGMPKPTGKVNVELTGGNALLDRLIQMGLIQDEMANGMRMMMAMFAVPQGDDTLTSELEINEDGHIIANGQRIQ